MIISVLASVLTAIQLVPQAYKALTEKNLKGISLSTFSLVSFTSFLWIIHGLNNHDSAVIFANAITFICSLLIVLRKMVRKNNK